MKSVAVTVFILHFICEVQCLDIDLLNKQVGRRINANINYLNPPILIFHPNCICPEGIVY